MKKIFIPFFCFFAFVAQAQWSNTSNQFYDSLVMPVTAILQNQVHSIVLKSYPDSGYFVIWDDARTTGVSSDIYAQKYDKNGIPLWTLNGIAVVAGPNIKTLATPNASLGDDYRYVSHACTDSAGGFYVVWDDDQNLSGTVNHRVCAQHMLTDGTARFSYPGFIVIQRMPNFGYEYANPQLIADGNKGCFIAYARYGDSGERDLFVNCYRDENGTMKLYGGNQADLNAENQLVATQCGADTKNNAIYPEGSMKSYQIYSDLQGGCNIVFTTEFNTAVGNERQRVGFNRLCRVKKQSQVTVVRRNDNLVQGKQLSYTLKKDSVVMLYTAKTFFYDGGCDIKNGNGTITHVAYTNIKVENFGNGFLNLSDLSFLLGFPKGVMVPTDGNTNINLIACSQQDYHYVSNTPNDWYKRMFIRNQEIYDSIPYQLSSDDVSGQYFAYKLFPDKALDKINYSDDTLMAAGPSYWDFAFAAANNRIFAAGMVQDASSSLNPRWVSLQQLQVDRMSSDSFAVHYHTSGKTGVKIGKEIATGFGDQDIKYDNPFISTDERGNALFTITDLGRSVHVSPIADSGRLVWGAMGKPIATGRFGGHYYNMINPYAVSSPTDGTAVVAWNDDRYIGTNYTDNDIYMRHLDSLNFYNYLPPPRAVNFLSYGGTLANPVVLTGTSLNWSYMEGYNSSVPATSTISAIFDNFNLGSMKAIALDNILNSPVRTYNGKPYLDRNYTMIPENKPNGAAAINMRLYFTTAQFTALKTADPAIISPADLMVLKQPNTTGTIPSVYTPAAGEEMIVPDAWSEVNGGYYLQFKITSFSNFFIEKNNGVLPVTWLNVQAQRINEKAVEVNWSVATEINTKNYLVQYSEDGATWKDGCTVIANNRSNYSCMLTLNNDKKYFFKIKETDVEGRYTISKTVWLDKQGQDIRFVISPNPVHQDATLNYSVPIATEGALKLINSAGVVVWIKNTQLSTAGTLSIPMNRLPAGIYTLQIITGTATQFLNILKD